MREICLVHLDKTRPALVLTRQAARSAMTKVTVAPITSTVKGLSSEVRVGPDNGLDHECAIALDNVVTVPTDLLGRTVGYLSAAQERAGASRGPCLRPRLTPARLRLTGAPTRHVFESAAIGSRAQHDRASRRSADGLVIVSER